MFRRGEGLGAWNCVSEYSSNQCRGMGSEQRADDSSAELFLCLNRYRFVLKLPTLMRKREKKKIRVQCQIAKYLPLHVHNDSVSRCKNTESQKL